MWVLFPPYLSPLGCEVVHHEENVKKKCACFELTVIFYGFVTLEGKALCVEALVAERY